MHKFFKKTGASYRLPSYVNDIMYERIVKRAHEIWAINSDKADVVVQRLAEEKTFEKEEPIQIKAGDKIILLLGGRSYRASVVSRDDDGILKLAAQGGEIGGIHESWVQLAQAELKEMAIGSGGGKFTVYMYKDGQPDVKRDFQTMDQARFLMNSMADGGYVEVDLIKNGIF